MLTEHDQGRAFIRGMSEGSRRLTEGDTAAVGALVSNALGYAKLLREHIDKENGVLFMMADQMLSDGEQNELVDAFEEIERTRTGPGEHERYHAMIAQYQKAAEEWNRVPA
jgi:hemerythrin-like domain-containing protein